MTTRRRLLKMALSAAAAIGLPAAAAPGAIAAEAELAPGSGQDGDAAEAALSPPVWDEMDPPDF